MSSSSSFPLLKLPFLCIELALCNTEMLDLITFSLASKGCHKLVKLVKTSVENINFIVSKDNVKIWLETKEHIVHGELIFNFEKPEAGSGFRVTLNRYVDPTPIDNSELLKYYNFISDDLDKSIKSSIAYFKDLFKRPTMSELRIYPAGFPKSKCPYRLNEQFKKLTIIGEEPMKNQELKKLIARTNFDKNLYLNIPIRPEFDCDPILFQKEQVNLVNVSASWVTKEFLFSLTAKHIHIRFCDSEKITGNDFVEFIDRWYNSTENRFRSLQIHWKVCPEAIDLSEYRPVLWDENRRSSSYPINRGYALDFKNGYDIKRADGTWATIQPRVNTLIFCVWEDLFPSLEGMVIV